MARNINQQNIRKVHRAKASVQQTIRIILEAYTGREIEDFSVVHDLGEQYAVRVRDDEHYLVNLRQWNNGLDLDVVCAEDVEELQFTQWPPVRRG